MLFLIHIIIIILCKSSSFHFIHGPTWFPYFCSSNLFNYIYNFINLNIQQQKLGKYSIITNLKWNILYLLYIFYYLNNKNSLKKISFVPDMKGYNKKKIKIYPILLFLFFSSSSYVVHNRYIHIVNGSWWYRLFHLGNMGIYV